MKITVALENSVPFNSRVPLKAEHGVSFLIELGGARVLYDTGQTGAVVDNLAQLGVPISSIDAIAISHGHYDHTGGLLAVLKLARKDVAVTIHRKAFGDRLSVSGEKRHSIGVPFAQGYITAMGKWTLTETPTEVVPGLWFSGTIPRVTDYEKGDKRLMVERDGAIVRDPLEDDAVLYWAGRKGLVVIGGCAHSGLVNAVTHGFTVTRTSRLQGWIGGTHLGPAGEEQQNRTIQQLLDWNPDFVAANHCTGFPMMNRLKEVFGDRFIPAFVGETMTIE